MRRCRPLAHPLLRTFGTFTTPTFVAVDNSCAAQKPPLTESTTPKCSEFDPSNGDVYVADTADNVVQKFNPSGDLITSWGTNGELDGSTATDGPFGSICGDRRRLRRHPLRLFHQQPDVRV